MWRWQNTTHNKSWFEPVKLLSILSDRHPLTLPSSLLSVILTADSVCLCRPSALSPSSQIYILYFLAMILLRLFSSFKDEVHISIFERVPSFIDIAGAEWLSTAAPLYATQVSTRALFT